MRAIHIGTAREYLRLTASDRVSHAMEDLTAELCVRGLTATRLVVHHYAIGFHDLAAFFTDLERDWRGWEGVRSWDSLEGDLKIKAQHSGHIQLQATLRDDWSIDEWTVTANLTIEPGEQLSRIAEEARTLSPF